MINACLAVFLFLGPAAQAASPYVWKNATVLGGGFITGVEFSPAEAGLVYSRTDIGGAYRWDAGASAWIPLNDMYGDTTYNYMGIESLAPDPVDPDVVYAAGGMYLSSGNGVILRSADRGATWTVNSINVAMGGNHDGRSMGERLVVDPNLTSTLYFASRRNGLRRSVNSGTAWAAVASFPVTGMTDIGLSFVVFDKASGSSGVATPVIYVGVANTLAGSNLYRSTDSGATWALVAGGGPSGLMPHHGALASDGTLYLAYGNGPGPNGAAGGRVWKLTTGSGLWTDITPPSSGGAFGGVSVDASDPLHIVAGTLDWWNPDRLYRSSNGGSTWSIVSRPPVSWDGGGTQYSMYDFKGAQYLFFGGSYPATTGWMGDVDIDPFDPDRATYVTGQGIWMTRNLRALPAPQSVLWSFENAGLEENAVTDMVPSVNGALLSALGDLGGFRHSDLSAPTASGAYQTPLFGNTVCLDFAGLNPNIVARVGTSGAQTAAFSTDNGATWAPFPVIPTGTARRVAVSADGGRIIWAPQGAVAQYSDNFGTSWTSTAGLPSGARVSSDRVNPLKFYSLAGGNLYASLDGGATFAIASSGLSGSTSPRCVFGVEGEVWVISAGQLWRSTASGAGAAAIATISNVNAVGFGQALSAPTDPPAIYAIGRVSGVYGFYRSDDQAASWTRINDDQHQFGSAFFAAGDELVPGRMYVGTNGRGILYGDLPSLVSPTPTRSFSPTYSVSPTFTVTRTVTVTRTSTPTRTDSPSPTATMTASPTLTTSPSSSDSPTETATPSASPSLTETPSLTPSPSSSETETASPTESSTITVTSTESPSPSSTATNSPTLTPAPVTTASPAVFALPSEGLFQAPQGTAPPIITDAALVPSPLNGPNALLVLTLKGNADTVTVAVFSSAYTKVALTKFTVPMGPGRNYLPLNASAWPQGMVFLRAEAEGHGSRSARTAKGYVLR